MAIKNLCQVGLICFFMLFAPFVIAQLPPMDGEYLQINTHFRQILSRPTWVLILRDIDSGQVLPYLFDLRQNDNFWVAFSSSQTYQVTLSTLQFDTGDEVHNFCNLQDGYITRQSMTINLSGVLSPDKRTFKCYVMKYQSYPLPIAGNN